MVVDDFVIHNLTEQIATFQQAIATMQGQLAAIRTWARANGYQVAYAGVIRKTVVDAYDAAHRTTNLAVAG
ncbi:Lsr2 family DNA-binding protein [Streptomyces mirabilis]|uniref:Lsr2 family DNA-binding protein n=1 Tax=Streptomyces mirabilis TaxID=68239 RepID=UPI002259DEBB|nr:histone-like nucleoid-structuring protein Lsr2 [Streptomyces mirabilis]MCX4616480.1 Lsr2 family protein [Streptomyces mirabilis]MCX5346762.1 Lsr2 family protein [Streptomyces mirabilis]